MTYLELMNIIKTLNPEQLGQSVTLHTSDDEFIPVGAVGYTDETCDVLDVDHLYLIPETYDCVLITIEGHDERKVRGLINKFGRVKTKELKQEYEANNYTICIDCQDTHHEDDAHICDK